MNKALGSISSTRAYARKLAFRQPGYASLLQYLPEHKFFASTEWVYWRTRAEVAGEWSLERTR